MSGSDKNPGRLALKCLLLVGMVLVSYLAVLCLCARCDRYLAVQLDKMALLRATPSPRLVLLGGSNLAFGIDSARLEQAAGVPVVNMGLHSGLGLKYMLDSAGPLLRKGDRVLVVPEYHYFVGRQFYGDSTLLNLFLMAPDPVIFRALRPSMLLTDNQTIFRFTPLKYLKERGGSSGFDSHGDAVWHLQKENVPFSTGQPFETDVNYAALDYLARFLNDCAARGISATVVFPCLTRSSYRLNSQTISRIEKALRQRTPHLAPVSPAEFAYEDSMFFDTIYHLNAKGRKARTEKIAALLKML